MRIGKRKMFFWTVRKDFDVVGIIGDSKNCFNETIWEVLREGNVCLSKLLSTTVFS